MNFRTSRNLGCIGALMITLGIIVTGVITIYTGINFYSVLGVGSILVILISVHSLSNFYQAKNIFINARISAIVAIIGFIIISAFSVVSLVISNITSLFLFLGVIMVFATVAAVFARRSLNELAVYSGVSEFASVGKLLLIGAVLTIFAIGILFMWIAMLCLAIAFFQLKEHKPAPLSTTETLSPLTLSTVDNRTISCFYKH